MQEINSQPQSVVKGLFKDDPWTQKFKELLKIRGYISIKSEQMQGLLIILFAKKQHLLHIREVESEYTRTGLGGIWVTIQLICHLANLAISQNHSRETKVLLA